MTVSKRQPVTSDGPARESREYLRSSPEPARPRRMPGAVVFLIAVALIGAVGMLYLLQTNHVANLGYEMSQLQEEREAALVEQQRLSAQIAETQALTTIESTARIELGMRPLSSYVFLDVELPPTKPSVANRPTEADKSSSIERFWNRLTGSSTGSEEVAQDD